MMPAVYLKTLRKSWLSGVVVPLFVVVWIPMIMTIWPELKAQVASFEELLKSPVYKVIIGELVSLDLGTWQGFFYMEVFMIVEYCTLFITILVPARSITTEVDKKTLDVVLSYPIPRWRFLLEKFCVYLTFNTLFPILIFAMAFACTTHLGETLDYTVLAYSLVGVWLRLFALGAVTLLCGAVFLEGNRVAAVSSILILGQYILLRYAGLVESMHFLKNWSLFNYLNPTSIMETGVFPFSELLIVSLVGFSALLAALYIFQKRELAY